jgi:hypothetical protein
VPTAGPVNGSPLTKIRVPCLLPIECHRALQSLRKVLVIPSTASQSSLLTLPLSPCGSSFHDSIFSPDQKQNAQINRRQYQQAK